MGQTVVEKIAQAHMAEGPPGRPLRAGDFLSVRPFHVMTHDNTSAVMKKFRAIGAPRIEHPRQPVFVLDHDIQNTSTSNLDKYAAIEAFAREQGVDFHPAGTGIGHQIMVAEGYVVPGSLCVASDSHANMYGALGALGTPIVRTDAAAVWAMGEFWWQVPRTVQVVLEGEFENGATGKDLILALCGLYNKGEALNAAVEFAGDGVRSLSMDARMTVANMTTEWGALAGVFPVDEITSSYFHEVQRRLAAKGLRRFSEHQLEQWEHRPLVADPDAPYSARIYFDLSELRPQLTGPDTVQAIRPLAVAARERIRVHKAYLLSCVNSRLEDLEAAARVVSGRRVAEGVEFYVAAASAEIQQLAEISGAWQILLDAGARALPPGCGPCIGLGAGLLEPGEVAISATNRNFKGRMGSREAQAFLASPEVVAASAVAGYIAGPSGLELGEPVALRADIDVLEQARPASGNTAILPGFPERIEGRLLFLPANNLNTDGIYGKDYTYQELAPERMAEVVMENYDPEFAKTARRGDLLVGSWNFGTGSSREQAVTALQAKGISLLIAGSFSQTYLRNAFNNGFICITCPPLVSELHEQHRERIEGKELTIRCEQPIVVDFKRSVVRYGDQEFGFSPLGSVPQSLVLAGGIENQVRTRLRLHQP